jgi:hypothetical protein
LHTIDADLLLYIVDDEAGKGGERFEECADEASLVVDIR